MDILRAWLIIYEPVDMYMTILLLSIQLPNRKIDIAIALCSYDRNLLKFARISHQYQMGIGIHTYLLILSIQRG